MKKKITCLLLISTSLLYQSASGEVLIDFGKKGGTSSAEETITLSDLGNNPISYSNTQVSFGGAGLSNPDQDSFAATTVTGQIVITGHGYSDDGPADDGTDDFDPDTWTGGDLTGTFEGTTGAFNSGPTGPGVADASGFSILEEGEAILLQFDLSGMNVPDTNTYLVLRNVEIFLGSTTDPSTGWWLYKRNTNVATGVSGAGVLVGSMTNPPPDIVIEDGATFAITGEYRLTSLTLEMIGPEITGMSYAQWKTDWIVDIGNGTNDYDADGLNNFYEYGMGGNPTNALDQGTLPTFTKSGNEFFYTHPMRSDDETITYTVKTTTNLVDGVWGTTGYTVDGTNTDASLYIVTNTVNTVEDEKFIKLVIE